MSHFLFPLLSLFALTSCDWVSEFDYNQYLDEANTYRLFWTVLNESHIEFGVSAATTGWIGFGISPNGQMPLSDIAFAWFDESDLSIHLQDRHVGKDRVTPMIDEQQDLELIDGFQVNGVTSFRFIRSIIPCDTSDDLPIIDGTTRVIYAWNGDGSDDDLMWHSTNRGSKSINILAGIFKEDGIDTSNTAYFDAVVTNYNVPSDDTTYYDTYFELPATAQKQHIIKFEPIITPGNELAVHHIVMYKCQKMGLECGSPAFAWAIGGGPFSFPDYVGLEMSTNSDGLRYFRLEIHYDNPTLSTTMIDNSGMRTYYTPNLRQYDAGLMELALGVGEEQFIVPGLENSKNTVYCTSECTDVGIPPGGVKVIGSVLHTHVYGKALNFRHVRNGVELPPIDTNLAYDFNYQQMVNIPTEPTILPGDDLILDCIYDTSAENRIIYGGLSTAEEMCQVYFYVYPKPALAYCQSDFVQSDVTNWENQAVADGYLSYDGNGDKVWTQNPGHVAAYDNFWADTSLQREVICATEAWELVDGMNGTGPFEFTHGFVEYVDNATCSNSTSTQMVMASDLTDITSPTSSPTALIGGGSSTTSSTTRSKVCNLQSDEYKSDGGISVSVFVDIEFDEVTITMSGPSDVWWGVGFDQTTMHQLYTIVVYEDGTTIEERRLASFSKGVSLTQVISVESNTVDGVVRTLVVKRPRLGETYNFPKIATSVNVLTGFGAKGSQFATATSMAGHSPSASNAPILTFSQQCDDGEVEDESGAYGISAYWAIVGVAAFIFVNY